MKGETLCFGILTFFEHTPLNASIFVVKMVLPYKNFYTPFPYAFVYTIPSLGYHSVILYFETGQYLFVTPLLTAR